MAIVYKVENKINNKIYIGVTTKPLYKRKKQHEYIALCKKSKFLFHKALRKYGINNFKWYIIETCEIELIEEREKFFIKENNSFMNNGYNMTKGGLYNFGNKGEFHYLNRMNENDRNKWIKKYMVGKNNGMYQNGDIVSGENHFSNKMNKKEKEEWQQKLKQNNYQKNMTKEELKNKSWFNKLSKTEKEKWIKKNLSGKNNPFYKNTKYCVLTFPDDKEYLIKVMEFCKNYKDVKLHSSALYSCARGDSTSYKGFKCRLANEKDMINIKKYN